jgi:GT2 family glycosyltransferase
MSTDRTRELIKDFELTHPDLSLRLVDNPDRHIPKALNLGIEAARGDLIIRMDSHAAPSAGYVKRCVELLLRNDAAVVGMYCSVQPSQAGVMARAIASVVSHPFGIGDASYRLDQASPQQLVDTVAFGAFRKALWQELGGFNEALLTNEDYDFNYRVRAAGGAVLLDRAEHTTYFARGTLGGLITQYSRYGKWKARMIRLHPTSLKARHLVAPVFVLSLLTLPILGLWWWPAWAILAIELFAYFCLALYFAAKISRRKESPLRLMLLLPIVFFTLHITWGVSFLLSVIQPSFKERKPLPV